MTESLWRGVEEPVLSEAEGTSAMLVNRCSSEFSGHQNHERNQKVTTSRDDKGKGDGFIESGSWTEAFSWRDLRSLFSSGRLFTPLTESENHFFSNEKKVACG
jgi:hypothetical protein